MTSLPEIFAAARREGSSLSYPIPEDWGQGRATFGGLVASVAAHALRAVVVDAPPLRALQVNFVGPVAAGEAQVGVQQLRQGKNVRQAEARVMQEGVLAAVVIGVFGGERTSALPLRLPAQPATTPPEALPDIPFVAGAMPNFLRKVAFRWAEGDAPFSGGQATHSRIHVKLNRGAADVATELLTVLLADAPPTPMLGHFRQPMMASSVSWSLELLPLATAPGEGWWRVDTDVSACAAGYAHQHTRLWTPEGQLAALGSQMVAVFG